MPARGLLLASLLLAACPGPVATPTPATVEAVPAPVAVPAPRVLTGATWQAASTAIARVAADPAAGVVAVAAVDAVSLWDRDGRLLTRLDLGGLPVCDLVRDSAEVGFVAVAAHACAAAAPPGRPTPGVRVVRLGPTGTAVLQDRTAATTAATGPGAREIAVADRSGVTVFDHGATVATIAARGVTGLAFAARGERLVVVGTTGVGVGPTVPYGPLRALGPAGTLRALLQGDRVLVGDPSTGKARLWDVRAAADLGVVDLPAGARELPALAWRGDRAVVASAAGVRVWADLPADGVDLPVDGAVLVVAIRGDGAQWAFATADRVEVHDAADGHLVGRMAVAGTARVLTFDTSGAIWVGYADGRVTQAR